MDPDVYKFIVHAVISLCGALLAAFLAAHLAMLRFRKEKLWQRKSEIYSELINELHELKYPKERFFSSLVEGIKIDNGAGELIRQEKDSHAKVLQIAERSSFILNNGILSEIGKMDQYINRAKNQASAIEQYQDEIHAINECISRVMAIGRKDLQI